jgi:serine/threonine-protein kinase
MQLAEDVVVAGKFRLKRKIGQGGMGSVWEATHLGLDIPCAVKFIEGDFVAHPEAQARFEREAKAAALVRSSHVVQILDHGVWENTPYIAMELLEGEDLRARLAVCRTMHPAELVPIVEQVCRVLTKAHAAQIVHRDLKPDNIFLVREDDREVVKVLDFGIAKHRKTALDGSGHTRTGAILGSPNYMSPEQAEGNKDVDHRSDLWSLAVIVYRAVTGVLPFDSDGLGDLIMRIVHKPIPVPSAFAPVPPHFDAWWAKAASRDPNERFQSAREFAQSLSMALGQSGRLQSAANWGDTSRAGSTPDLSRSVPLGQALYLKPSNASGPGSAATIPASRPSFGSTANGLSSTDGFGRRRSGVAIFVAAGAGFVAVLTLVAGTVLLTRARHASPPSALASGPTHASAEPPSSTAAALPVSPSADPAPAPASHPASAQVPAVESSSAPTAASPPPSEAATRVSAPARPSAPAPASKPTSPARGAPRSSAPAAGPKNCNPPYFIDAAGNRQYKVECLD